VNASNAKDYLPLVQALSEGKVIQYKYQKSDKSYAWMDLESSVDFCMPAEFYRIKPEPREIFVVIDNDNDGSHLAFHSEDDAIKDVGSRDYAIRRYREVIE